MPLYGLKTNPYHTATRWRWTEVISPVLQVYAYLQLNSHSRIWMNKTVHVQYTLSYIMIKTMSSRNSLCSKNTEMRYR
jgi:hypothetical protein